MKKPYYSSKDLTDISLKTMKTFRSFEYSFRLIQNMAAFNHSGIEFSYLF